MKNEFNELSELDELIDSIGKWILEDEGKPGILNPVRLQQMRFAHAVLKRVIENNGATIKYSIHEPFRSMGSITVEGSQLEFTDCKWLGRAMEFASNVEIYPLSSEGVRLVLTFHDLVVRRA